MVVSASASNPGAAAPGDTARPVSDDNAGIVHLDANAPDYQARVAELVEQGYRWSEADAGFRKAG